MNRMTLIKLSVFYGLLFYDLCFSLPVLAAKEYRLYISPTPPDAEIKILNIKPKFHQGIQLPVGRYDVLVAQSGYHSRRFWVDISNRSRRILVTLKPEAPTQARLFIKTHPPQARIKILNIKPPFQQGMALAPGIYDIEVSHAQFVTQRQKVELGDTDERLEIQLEQEETLEQMLRQAPANKTALELSATTQSMIKKYALHVTTEPADADISLLNRRIDFQSGMLLPAGTYQLKIAKAGYTPRIRWIDIQDQDFHLHVRLSEPEYCFIQQQTLGQQEQQRQVRLHFYLDYVEAWYNIQILPAGALHTFRLLGQRQGNQIDLLGKAYYEQEVIEVRSQMQLQGKQLIMYFDGKEQRLQQVHCDKLLS